MTSPVPTNRELLDLLNAVWDQGMDEATRAKIEELIGRDPTAAVNLLVSYSRLHLDLEMLVSSDAAHAKALQMLMTTSRRPRRWNWRRHKVVAGWVGAAAAIFVAMFGFWNDQPVGHEHLIRTAQPVGQVVHLENTSWGSESGVQVGNAVVEGQTLDLRQGFAQLSMGFGADVLLQGPCRAKILTNKRVALDRGKIGVRAAKWAMGFQVETDDLIATDLGTWFSVQASAEQAEVHVLEGLVLADPAKAGDSPNVTRRLSADEAIKMSRDGQMRAIAFRRDAAADRLTQFEPLRPVDIWNTGIGLKVGEKDPHWRVVAGSTENGVYPQPAVVSAPHGSYGINEPDRSQWISVERGTTNGAPARASYTFETSFDLTGFDLNTVVVSGLVLADDGVDEVWLNGEQLDIKPWKDWGYGVVYNNFHPIEIHKGFVSGTNRLSFVVKNETFINRSERGFDLPETPNPMALRVEWQAFGRPFKSGEQE